MDKTNKRSVKDHLRHFLKRIVRIEGRLDAVDALEKRVSELSERLDALESESRVSPEQKLKTLRLELESRFQQIEGAQQTLVFNDAQLLAQSEALSNLFAARHRLQACLDPSEIMKTVSEILTEVLGAEAFAVFLLEPDKKVLKRVAGVGDEQALQTVPFGAGILGLVARNGKPFFYESSPARRGGVPIAALPLKAEGRSVGAVAIYTLAGEKTGLTPVDHRLLEIIAEHVARAVAGRHLVALDGRRGSRGA